jgi:replication-associated recombination protein RarA
MAKFKLIEGKTSKNEPYAYNGFLNANNEFDILGTIAWPENNEYYVGEWLNNSRTGKGMYLFPSGECYFGGFKSTNKQGIGLRILPDKSYFLGHYNNNLPEGLGLKIYTNGDFVYGNLKNGKLHDKAVYYHANTQTFEFNLYENGQEKQENLITEKLNILGSWNNAPIFLPKLIKQSYGYSSGKNSSGINWELNGQFNKNICNGIGLMEWSDNAYYFGEFQNDKRTGCGMYKYNNQDMYFGGFLENNFHGKGLYYQAENKKYYFGNNNNHKRTGHSFIMYEDGDLYFGNYVNDKLDGNVLIIDKDMNVTYNTYKENKYISEDKVFNFYINNNHNNQNNDSNEGFNLDELEQIINNKPNNNQNNGNSNKKYESNTNIKQSSKNAAKELDELIGLQSVKRELKRIKAYAVKNKEKNPNVHMAFLGNPGTGKTVVARLIGQILYEAGVLKNNNFIECSRETLISMYVGETALKTKKVIDEAMGGVLFIDEAYSFNSNSEKDFGKEAIVELLKAMEDHRGEFCCIMAGYTKEMADLFNMNPGFKSRVQFFIDFPDYSKDELIEIGKLMLKNMDYQMDQEALEIAVKIAYRKRLGANFANAREVRNILEKTAIIQALRTEDDLENRTIILEDVKTFAEENNIPINNSEDDKTQVPMVKLEYLEELAKKHQEINVVDNLVDVREAVISLKVDMPTGKSESSGFLITPDGYAVTCAHCVNGERGIQVRRRILDRRGNQVDVYYKAEVVAMDVLADVAIIKLLDLDGDNAYIDLLPHGLLDYDTLDNIIMLGYPFGVSRFDNISTNVGKIVSYQKRTDGPDFINIYLSAKSGNSGSGVLNLEKGYAIGVLCGGSLNQAGALVEEVNYCRPISYVWDLIERNQPKEEK